MYGCRESPCQQTPVSRAATCIYTGDHPAKTAGLRQSLHFLQEELEPFGSARRSELDVARALSCFGPRPAMADRKSFHALAASEEERLSERLPLHGLNLTGEVQSGVYGVRERGAGLPCRDFFRPERAE